MRWDRRSYEIASANRVYRPLLLERRSLRLLGWAALWIGTFLLAKGWF